MTSASIQLSSSTSHISGDSKMMDSNISTSYSLYNTTSEPPLLIDISDEPVQSQSTKSFESNSSVPTPGTPQSTLSSVIEISKENNDVNDEKQSSSIKPKKTEKQRKFFSSFSIRRKSKSSKNNKQQNNLPIPELPESASMYTGKAKSFTEESYEHDTKSISTITTTNTNITSNSIIESSSLASPKYHQQQQNTQKSVTNNAMSLHVPQLRKASSFTDPFFNRSSPQSKSNLNNSSNILVDDEGFSIPPPDRSPWSTIPNNNSNIDDNQDTDDLTSLESGSLNGISPSIIKLDIKNDSVVQEDAKTSQIALTRVASMLKEKNTTAVKRPRGRRELRSQYFGNNTNDHSFSSYHTASSSSISASPLSLSTITTTPPIDETLEENEINKNEKDITTSPTSYDSPFLHEDDQLASNNNNDNLSSLTTEQKIINDFNQLSTSSTPSSLSPPIKLRITETIHAQILNGQVVQSKIVGEIAILYEGPRHNIQQPIYFILKQDDLEVATLEKYVIAKGKSKKNKNGMKYQITPNLIQELDYVTCIKYQLSQQPSDKVIPLMVKPMWKCDGDQARLMVKYYKNSKCNTSSSLQSYHIDQLIMVTKVSRDCSGVQSMPTGEWMIDQQKIMWSLEGNDIKENEEQMIRARFSTKYKSDPQPIAIRFLLKDQLLTSFDVITHPQLDHSHHNENALWANIVQIEKNTRSGKYIAEIN